MPADLSDLAALERLNAGLPQQALVISSDLIRAVHTADAISAGRTRLDHDADLREFDFGAWDGLHFSEVSNRDPHLSRAFWENPGDLAAPEGESWNQVAARAAAVLERLHHAHLGQDIIIVAHFGMILTQLGLARNEDPKHTLSQKIDNLSVTRLERHNHGWETPLINHVF